MVLLDVFNQGVVELGRFNTVLSVNMAETHVSRIHDKERGVYGLTTIGLARSQRWLR